MKPFRAESSKPGWFQAWTNRSYPEGKGCYCASARCGWLWRSWKQGRPKERRRKAGQSEHQHWEGHTAKARLVKTFQDAGDVTNDTAVM